MFRCNHCHTEYGGIRGISADSCPRCRAQRISSQERRQIAHISVVARRDGHQALSPQR